MKEFFTKKVTKKEANLILWLITVIGILVCVLTMRGYEGNFIFESRWFSFGVLMAFSSSMLMVAPCYDENGEWY